MRLPRVAVQIYATLSEIAVESKAKRAVVKSLQI
jgi:hypothetical protein